MNSLLPRCITSFRGLLHLLALLMLTFISYQAYAIAPQHVNLTFEGCKGSTDSYIPTPGGFICNDSEYTTGNLGKGWNELDLVPHRLTTTLGSQTAATTTYDLVVAGDHERSVSGGVAIGWDFISVPVVNTALSHASCQISAGDMLKTANDASIYRHIEITQDKGTTCVFDWVQRLALGSHLYPGSSLHSNTLNENLGTAGVGNRDISIPVKEILPQTLDKTMSATKDTFFAWNIVKDADPANLHFFNTCSEENELSQDTVITVTWTKMETEGGNVTIVTNITAVNPSHRNIIIELTDTIYGNLGAGEVILDTKVFDPAVIPAGGSLTQTHTLILSEEDAGVTGLRDEAVATYEDPIFPEEEIFGELTAEASTDIIPSGNTVNDSAIITDVENITGNGLSFSVVQINGATGSFSGPTVGVTSSTWTSDPQFGNGFAVFKKTVHLDEPRIITAGAALSDTATLLGSDDFEKEATFSVGITAEAEVELTIDKSIANILQGAESATFWFDVYKDEILVDSVSITFNAGETNKSATVSGLEPGDYKVIEQPAAGFAVQQNNQEVSIDLPACFGMVEFLNNAVPAKAKVVKVTLPAGFEDGWEFTLSGNGVNETKTTAGGMILFDALLGEGNYTIVETEQDGWDLTRITNHDGSLGSCSFSVNLPADADKVFACEFENTARSTLIVEKVVTGNLNLDPNGTFHFTADSDAQELLLKDLTTTAFNTPVSESYEVKPGSYDLTEADPSANNFSLVDIACKDENDVETGQVNLGQLSVFDVAVAPGAVVTCTFTNEKLAAPGFIEIRKISIGGVDTFDYEDNVDSADSTGNFELTTVTEGVSVSHFFNIVEPGVYQVTELDPTLIGYDLTELECEDPKSGVNNVGTSTDLASRTATISVDDGETVVCTFTNTKRIMVDLLKLFNGVVNPAMDVNFRLYEGPDGFGGTLLASDNTLGKLDGLLTFGGIKLEADGTYTLCELDIPPGTTADWSVDGVPLTPYNPDADNVPPEDLGNRCIDFGAGTDLVVEPGDTLHLMVDNVKPEGDRRTPGYWSNWNRCTNGGQANTADKNGGSANGYWLLEDVLPISAGNVLLDNCEDAVKVLQHRSLQNGRVMAQFADFKLARSLVAAKANIAAGASQCADTAATIAAADALLIAVGYDGKSGKVGSKHPQYSAAINLHGILDDYNNNICH
ncbi:collagen binding domain-containing protein [Zobellella sp. DQSA1]|uniref:MSCRAMM family protein n=1 Tax=Zobellella sp. DQSA1 TaxID=3342386 RepID=UPI0035BF1D39